MLKKKPKTYKEVHCMRIVHKCGPTDHKGKHVLKKTCNLIHPMEGLKESLCWPTSRIRPEMVTECISCVVLTASRVHCQCREARWA